MAKFYLKCLTPTWYGEDMYLYNGLILTVAVEATGRTLCLGFRDSGSRAAWDRGSPGSHKTLGRSPALKLALAPTPPE